MAVSDNLFPDRMHEGVVTPYPGTLTHQPGPKMRPAQLSEEAFPDRPEAFYMTPIRTTQPYRKVPREVPISQLLDDAITAQERLAANRDRLTRRFIAAGLTEQAIGVTSRTRRLVDAQQGRINFLQDLLEQQGV